MNILLIGSGGREHAIAWKLCQSKLLSKLFIAPGNAGTETLGENVDLEISDFDQLKSFIINKSIAIIAVSSF